MLPFAVFLLCSGLLPGTTLGQLLTPLSLETMEEFRPTGANWQVAGNVASDRLVRHSLEAEEGTGVLVNLPRAGANANLFTEWTHGDIEIELELLMPRGSNAGLYLQGRYEVQMLDSWHVPNPSFGDMGGIYQRWDEAEGRGYEGHPPRVNAARAPGLWQSLRVVFTAPRFDADGNKTQNARFELVKLNGSTLHQGVEVTGPTRAAAFDDEAAMGPLMVQGDHGPVALRNIRYKRYGQDRVTTREVRYRVFEGEHITIPLMEEPTEAGTLDHLGALQIGANQPLLVALEGLLDVPATGLYQFGITLDWITGDPHFQDNPIGGAELVIGEEQVLLHDINTPTVHEMVNLLEGAHAFELVIHKMVGWRPPGVSLIVEGPDTPQHFLMEAPRRQPPAPIGAAVGREPVVQRGFLMHEDVKRTTAVSVGDPSGVHYSVDLGQAALLYAWRGPFVDATAMWLGRGHDQLMHPEGSLQVFPYRSPVENPASGDSLRPLGYRLDSAGRPVFRYALGALTLEDAIRPAEAGPFLWRTVTFSTDGIPPEELWVRAATGASIEQVQDGIYAVDDRTYYIETLADTMIKADENGAHLMLPVRFEEGGATVSYAIVW